MLLISMPVPVELSLPTPRSHFRLRGRLLTPSVCCYDAGTPGSRRKPIRGAGYVAVPMATGCSMADVDLFLKVLLAGVLGFIVGAERELSGQQAGDRTFTLVAMGSALFTVIAIHAFGTSADAPSRIIANILTGVGFLGGGLILHQSGGVQGLTTAAGIWAIAAVGVAVGSEHYLVAVLTTALILFVFSIKRMRFLDVRRLFSRGGSRTEVG